jgi:hypothetical protein
LLRGELSHVYLDGQARRLVCELCTARALHEGWVREGAIPESDGRGAASDRRRSLLSRLRGRREAKAAAEVDDTPIDQSDGSEGGSWTKARERIRERVGQDLPRGRPHDGVREPRHVRAVPMSVEQKIASAIDVFNGSEHRRTVAGVARSLGVPGVSIIPVHAHPSLVNVVVAWELCWYRYEIDLSDEVPSVRLAGQGYELGELPAQERQVNAVSDEHGSLLLSE